MEYKWPTWEKQGRFMYGEGIRIYRDVSKCSKQNVVLYDQNNVSEVIF